MRRIKCKYEDEYSQLMMKKRVKIWSYIAGNDDIWHNKWTHNKYSPFRFNHIGNVTPTKGNIIYYIVHKVKGF